MSCARSRQHVRLAVQASHVCWTGSSHRATRRPICEVPNRLRSGSPGVQSIALSVSRYAVHPRQDGRQQPVGLASYQASDLSGPSPPARLKGGLPSRDFRRYHHPLRPPSLASEVVLNIFAHFGPRIQCPAAHAELHRPRLREFLLRPIPGGSAPVQNGEDGQAEHASLLYNLSAPPPEASYHVERGPTLSSDGVPLFRSLPAYLSKAAYDSETIAGVPMPHFGNHRRRGRCWRGAGWTRRLCVPALLPANEEANLTPRLCAQLSQHCL